MQTLPPEVLSEIFLNCIVTKAITLPSRAPILLTRVNRLWRAVALSTPRLWSYLYLERFTRSLGAMEPSELRVHMPSGDVTKTRSYVTALRTWLSLSKRTPLTLRFWVHDIHPTSGDKDIVAKYMRILCTHSARWKDIEIRIPHNVSNFIPILNQCRSLPFLESFYFDNWQGGWEPIDITLLESAPLLRRARITHPFLESWFLPWSQLTRLSIESCFWCDMDFSNSFDMDVFIDILSHCINLEVLKFLCDLAFCPSVTRSKSTFAVLPQLQSLRMVIFMGSAVEDNMDEAEIIFALLFQCLTHLVLPKLRTLELPHYLSHHNWDDSFLQFSTHFLESLENLKIVYCSIPLHVFTNMLECLSNLTSMAISFTVTDWEGILGELTLTSTAYGSKQLVPNLAELKIIWSGLSLNAESAFYEAFTTMIESRWQARSRRAREVGEGADTLSGLTTLCVGSVEKTMEQMTPLQRARMARCVEEGLCLEDWLNKPHSFRDPTFDPEW
ncbi:hypothetical protein EW146_g7389 [Bondarzewia mesenterica]|uniref:Uncharacterized protein n=1 Tax=Bondarzewia mesenterica TaxID=1095465 RepID=A0A4S4LL30_9AGAM|nr:hypothetical protein EW146_g7389 [Bondarzewia mesenterica]